MTVPLDDNLGLNLDSLTPLERLTIYQLIHHLSLFIYREVADASMPMVKLEVSCIWVYHISFTNHAGLSRIMY